MTNDCTPSLVGIETGSAEDPRSDIIRKVRFFRAALPDSREISRAEYLPFTRRYPKESDTYSPTFSADRKIMVHKAEHSVVCRKTDDLSVLWVRAVEPDYNRGAWALNMSPDGGRSAASVYHPDDPGKYYIGIYDGKDGSVLARLPIRTAGGVAFSADGKLFAVGETSERRNGLVDAAANIYETLSGDLVGRVTHPPVPQQRMHIAIGCRFTPDGKYLITNSEEGWIWSL